jgi:hypothetical protein
LRSEDRFSDKKYINLRMRSKTLREISSKNRPRKERELSLRCKEWKL